MSNDSDPHGDYRRQATAHFTPAGSGVTTAPAGEEPNGDHRHLTAAPVTVGGIREWNLARDAIAIVLLLIAMSLPWNAYLGAGTPNRGGWIFAVLVLVTVSSLAAIVTTYVGPRKSSAPGFDPRSSARRRLALNAPYLVLVLAFVVFTMVQTIRGAGTGAVAPGIGQGAWFGLTGCLLNAQPVITSSTGDDPPAAWASRLRIATIAAITLAAASTAFNLYWRTQYLFAANSFGGKEVAIVVLTSMYGTVALTVVVMGSRWNLDDSMAARLATIVLGTSTLAAGLIIWLTETGREIDAFHGIGQGTSTAAVGFEAFLCWAAALAVVAPSTLRALGASHRGVYREAARKMLLLIAFWYVAAAVLRATDLIVALSLDLHNSPYDTVALIVFDGAGAALAIWLRLNFTNRSLPARNLAWSAGALVVIAVSRIVLGVALAPRVTYVDSAPPYNPVFGNDLAQQITSTFDVVLCGLAVGVLVAAVAAGYRGGSRRNPAASPAGMDPSNAPVGSPEAMAFNAPRQADAATQTMSRGHADGTWPVPAAMPTIFRGASAPAATATLRIHRPDGSDALDDSTRAVLVAEPDAADRDPAHDPAPTRHLPTGAGGEGPSPAAPKGSPEVHRLLRESTQRFGAGTTYGGPPQGGPRPTGSPSGTN